MPLCKHGVSRDRRCDRCEEVAEAENRAAERNDDRPARRPEKFQPQYHNLDIHRLEEEWVAQDNMAREHGDAYSAAQYTFRKAETEVEICKAELKEVAARVDLAIRKAPEAFNVSKPTDKAVESRILIHEDYLEARGRLFDAMKKKDRAERDRDMAKVAYDTVVFQRKPALENLVSLWQGTYFVTPNLPHKLTRDRRTEAALTPRRGDDE